MTPLKRKSGNQYMHRKTEEYRKAVRRKLDAYHRFIQVGLVAQGIMVAIATTAPELVWASFGSWFRTIRYERCPSEMVVSIALRNNFPEFLTGSSPAENLVKFIRERLDFHGKLFNARCLTKRGFLANFRGREHTANFMLPRVLAP